MDVKVKRGRRVLTNKFIASVFDKASNNSIYDEYMRQEYKKVYSRLMFCVSVFHLFKNQENDFRISGLQCRDRFCSVCASIRAGKFSHKVSSLFHKFHNPHFLTITFGQRKKDLALSARDFRRCFLNFRQLKKGWWKKYVLGGFSSFEATFVENEGWHLHQHMIIDLKDGVKAVNTKGDEYQYVTEIKKELEKDLEKVGLGVISDIKPCDGSAVEELCKYIVKFTEFESEQAVIEAYRLKGFRQIQSFGIFYGQMKDIDLDVKTHEWRFVGKLFDYLKDSWSGLSPPSLDVVELTERALQLGIISKIQFKGVTV